MTRDEIALFSNLLFSHKRLFIAFETYRHLHEHPEVEWDEANELILESNYDVYQTTADALIEDRPISDPLNTVLEHPSPHVLCCKTSGKGLPGYGLQPHARHR